MGFVFAGVVSLLGYAIPTSKNAPALSTSSLFEFKIKVSTDVPVHDGPPRLLSMHIDIRCVQNHSFLN